MKPLSSIVVAGSGVPARLAAFALRRAMPTVSVKLLLLPGPPEDPAGESTTPLVLKFLCQTLGLAGADLHNIVAPVWNLGGKYLWGARGGFLRAYDVAYSSQATGLGADLGVLAAEEGLDAATLATALMAAGKLFPKDGPNSAKPIEHLTGLNLRPGPLGELLARACKAVGVETVEAAALAEVRRGPKGIDAVVLPDGRELTAGLFLDATGRDALLSEGGYRDEPGFCREIVTVMRRRGSEPIRPFSTYEALPQGYRWRVEHDDAVGMGFAWHPEFCDADAARRVLMEKAGEGLAEPHFESHRPGRREEAWHGNVLSVGDAGGELDPFAGSRLGFLTLQLHWLLHVLQESGGMPGPESRRTYNRILAATWDESRDFVALHYRFAHIDSPFWKKAAEGTEFGPMRELVDLFGSIGPSPQLANCFSLWPGALGADTWIAALLGLGVPFRSARTPSAEDRHRWKSHIEQQRQTARQAVAQEICLAAVRRQHQPPPRRPPVEIF